MIGHDEWGPYPTFSTPYPTRNILVCGTRYPPIPPLKIFLYVDKSRERGEKRAEPGHLYSSFAIYCGRQSIKQAAANQVRQLVS